MINQKEISLLFIEDEKEIRKNYVDALKPLFKNIFEAEDGIKAYELYKEKKPEIIIVDINIPKLNGLELIEKIRQNDLSTKIIVLTAHSNESYLLKANELKLIKYLLKPVKRRVLLYTLETAIKEINTFDITSKNILRLKDSYIWNFNKKSLYKNSTEIELTKKEKDILQTIFQNPNIELTYDMIIESAWDNYGNSSYQNLKTRIMHIRKKTA